MSEKMRDDSRRFLERAGWGEAGIRAIAGDASTRGYFRLSLGEKTAILMDWRRGAPYKGAEDYSAKARLATSVHAFAAIGDWLRGLSLHAPRLYDADWARGLLLLEDLGTESYEEALAIRDPDMLYRAAIEALCRIHEAPPPRELAAGDGSRHKLPIFDEEILIHELRLFPDWFMGGVSPSLMDGWESVWRGLLAQLDWSGSVLLLRDYHAPNLIWREGAEGLARLGILDYQDAIVGPSAYDVASLLQDARLDVPIAREEAMRELYMERMGVHGGKARRAYLRNYAILGAQRAARILGIFVRLRERDSKPAYMAHIPRVLIYLRRNLAHPSLEMARAWLSVNLPRHFGRKEAR